MPKYDSGDLAFQITGQGEKVLFLHGWGQNKSMIHPIANLMQGYEVLCLDLPGFGDSKEPLLALSMDDYVQVIHDFLLKADFKPSIIIGHSFGGKLAFLYADKYKVKTLILIAPSLIKPSFNPFTKYKIIKYKILKRLNSKKLNEYGSNDYKQASPIMKKILVNATNSYYKKQLKDCTIPTMIYWGKNDCVTPIRQGKKINRYIKHSKLVISIGDHFAYFNYRYHFVNNFYKFMEDLYAL